MKMIKTVAFIAAIAASMGLQAQEGTKTAIFFDANKQLWQRDSWKMKKDIMWVVLQNKLLAAKLILWHPIALSQDVYRAIKSTLCDAQGCRIHGLNGYLTYFADKYNEPAIMNVYDPINNALAHIKPNYETLPLLYKINQQGDDLYVLSSNDRAAQNGKMACYVRLLQENGHNMPVFKDTFYATEYPECHEFGVRSEECKQKMRAFAGNPEKVVFAWEEMQR